MLSITVETFVWWGLMAGLWNALAPTSSVVSAAISGAGGILAAVAAVLTRRATGVSGRMTLLWARWLPVLAVSIVADTARVFALAVRHMRNRDVRGEFRTAWLARPAPSRAALHRALATLTVSSTPGSIVCDADPNEHRLVAHTIISGPPNLEKTVAR